MKINTYNEEGGYFNVFNAIICFPTQLVIYFNVP